jgi:hypothetical protein
MTEPIGKQPGPIRQQVGSGELRGLSRSKVSKRVGMGAGLRRQGSPPVCFGCPSDTRLLAPLDSDSRKDPTRYVSGFSCCPAGSHTNRSAATGATIILIPPDKRPWRKSDLLSRARSSHSRARTICIVSSRVRSHLFSPAYQKTLSSPLYPSQSRW